MDWEVPYKEQNKKFHLNLAVYFLLVLIVMFSFIVFGRNINYLLSKPLNLGKTVSLSLSHWYPGSGVVLDCIDS